MVGTPLRTQRPLFIDVTLTMSSVVRHARCTPVTHMDTQVMHSFAIAHSWMTSVPLRRNDVVRSRRRTTLLMHEPWLHYQHKLSELEKLFCYLERQTVWSTCRCERQKEWQVPGSSEEYACEQRALLRTVSRWGPTACAFTPVTKFPQSRSGVLPLWKYQAVQDVLEKSWVGVSWGRFFCWFSAHHSAEDSNFTGMKCPRFCVNLCTWLSHCSISIQNTS